MKTIRIRLLWHPQAQFAGYLVAQHLQLAASAGIALACEPMRRDQDGMTALLAGDAEMAVASPGHLLKAKQPEALRFILAIQQQSSLCYPVLARSGIRQLSDLAGRSVGVWPNNEDLEFRWMLKKAGIAEDTVHRVPMADTVDRFIAGEVASAQMTTYHELHLATERAGHEPLHLFRAGDHGADLLKDGLIARADWLARNGEQARAAVAAILEGWTIAFDDPRRAVGICRTFRPDMSEDEHAHQLAAIRDISMSGATLTHGLGYPDPQHVARAKQAMQDLGYAVPAIDAQAIADVTFWQAAPRQWRRTSWARS